MAEGTLIRQSPDAQQIAPPISGALARSDLTDDRSMHEQSEQQLEAYAASFSSSSRQRRMHMLKNHGHRQLNNSRMLQPVDLLPAIELDKPDVSTEVDHEIDETFLAVDPSTDHFGDDRRRDHFPPASRMGLDGSQDSENYQYNERRPSLWYEQLPSSPPQRESASPSIDIPNPIKTPVRPRAPSIHSFSSSFVLRPPTSPLARQALDDELDFSPVDLDNSPIRRNRRHTLPHQGLQALRTDVHPMTLAQAARQPPSLQRERTYPYQTHGARRSYTGLSFPTSPSPSTPNFLRSRRSSFASDASPVQASMVGSYEESILRGRMSTTPSKPLDFVARIGALGRGESKPKYPAHVSIGFPAVYYSWNISNGGSVTDEPSPYVGLIDLEHKLNTPATKEKTRKRKEPSLGEEELKESSVKSREARRKEKRQRTSRSPQDSLQSFGGCYRIPQTGQLQIMISNPHKTAVKLFLVPYDLEGMQPGTKTFIRQRSCSTGTILEKPLTSRSLSDSVVDTKSVSQSNKSVLRYLIQLNICCPAKDRYYLYKSIHVVFANRVPDDKEQLQVENLWPEPRFSPWRPSTIDSGASTPYNTSEFLSLSTPKRPHTHFDKNRLDAMDGLPEYPQKDLSKTHLELFNISRAPSKSVSKERTELVFRSISPDVYTKLARGESGYGGRAATPEPGEGLLARRLRGLVDEKCDGNDSIAAGESMDMA